MSRTGPVAAITGGTRGIGLAIAGLFLERGFRVAVCSRSPSRRSLPREILQCRADVSRREDAARFAREIRRRWGRLQVWVNCAGLSLWRPVSRVDGAFAAEMIEANLLSALWGCAEAARSLKRGGTIVNVSSLAGKRGSSNNSVYCAVKFAVNGITQALAKELGPRGIRVNAVCPVYVKTPRILSSLREPGSPAAGGSVSAYLRDFAQSQTALRRLPNGREVAEAVYFLATPAASAITGQCLNVDCGTFPQ